MLPGSKESPSNNIYMYVNHNLLLSTNDSIRKKQNAASDRLEGFFAQTFWKNEDAWLVQMACVCLTLAGRNVGRA